MKVILIKTDEPHKGHEIECEPSMVSFWSYEGYVRKVPGHELEKQGIVTVTANGQVYLTQETWNRMLDATAHIEEEEKVWDPGRPQKRNYPGIEDDGS